MDPDYHKVADTYAINSSAGTITVFTPDADKKFVVTKYYLECEAAGTVATTSVVFRSGTTNLSGAIPMDSTGTAEGVLFIRDGRGDELVFKGRANGDTFNITNSGPTNLRGYAVIAEVQE